MRLGHLTFLASFVQVACGLAGALESGQRDREGVRRRHQGGQEALPCAISPFAHGCVGQSQVFLTTFHMSDRHVGGVSHSQGGDRSLDDDDEDLDLMMVCITRWGAMWETGPDPTR